ncbi:MAG: benzoate/H(+) symporter BenE family transporter, partial [Actinomycetota bacterium]|nr:benzoate/H(+) symporter BenE family transporter [Actinomycetota bacterium]
MTITAQSGLREPIVAGIVTALVGFTSSFAVVIAGLRAVGATPEQAASGLFALTVVFGIGIIVLSVQSRAPITLAWSTPGAALLVSMGAGHDAGWAAAVGAFLVVGGLILLVGLIPVLGDLISRIPTPIAQAMLGGVLLSLCLAPMESLAAEPLLTLPVLIAWLVATRVVARWALPLTLLTALVVIAVYVWGHETEQPVESTWLPSLSWTTPQLDVAAIAGIAIPLFVVTMASQNIPGVAVLSSF